LPDLGNALGAMSEAAANSLIVVICLLHPGNTPLNEDNMT
jgi:hypothetical protein